MTYNNRLTRGDLRRLLSELRAQLPPGYEPFDDYWAAPYDGDCFADLLDHELTPEALLARHDRYAGHPPQQRYRRAS
ncbi:MAG: hypothetical protein WAW85_05380 [Gordonia sp. (in: high G+C Gram-positive bacteria)]|uniref:hypothetical protein n=1 Tax=Gordonia sp. (in: high G+C Gram-positive bacteria) TaxID=84139 RepID=UPI003BB4C2FA